MPIVHFATHSKQARAQADDLRNSQISQGKGALIVDEKQDGEPRHLLEKIIAGMPLLEPTPADKIPWKKDPLVILVGKSAPKALEHFEKLVPGFKRMFGPVKAISDA
jgi:hypothetical protein